MVEPVFDGRFPGRASLPLRAWGSLALLTTALGGCTTEPLPCLLELDEGDLVITEIRGPQQGVDTRGEWFEVFNATDRMIDLEGLRGELVNLKGSIEVDFIVRRSLLVEPGGYVVLGSLADPPPEVDYSFNSDFAVQPRVEDSDGTQFVPESLDSDPRALFTNARVGLWACATLIDSVVYAELPDAGTYSYDGAMPPDAEGNDDLTRWCADDTEAPPEGPQTELGLPGSPGEQNRPCG